MSFEDAKECERRVLAAKDTIRDGFDALEQRLSDVLKENLRLRKESAIEHEEAVLHAIRSDVFRILLAAALRRAGVRDEGQLIANSLSTREDSVPLPTTMADGVVAYLAAALEAGLAVRRTA